MLSFVVDANDYFFKKQLLHENLERDGTFENRSFSIFLYQGRMPNFVRAEATAERLSLSVFQNE
jgi:hypothetical protein